MYALDEAAKHNQIVLGAVLFMIAGPLEICRLYLGYSGNLKENVMRKCVPRTHRTAALYKRALVGNRE